MVAILLFWYLRRRRLHAVPTQSHPSVRSSTALDLSHPACRVTPFGSPSGDTSYFVHEPGVNMRVAHRLPDGGWEFSEIPSDSPATLEYTLPRRLSFSARSTLSYSSKEKLKLQPGELTTRGFVESDTDADDIPPPAYCHTEHSCVTYSES
ncbi:uncharacterized protein FIBRA_08287 [Fibroporia radiculosa]|uniref:Uncharacterized protein n=1 Tax=Fibroporia radiculosa TaxID=599839 RepID=J4IC99_9APHY|nr:uncharacterized protein FIBRA_08287 [Fibroporia radiculosa]CCM06041.1 predicted protein [Fibroporia radiculosa]